MKDRDPAGTADGAVNDDPFTEAAEAVSARTGPARVRPPDLHRRRLPLYLIGSGFLLLIAAEVWVMLR